MVEIKLKELTNNAEGKITRIHKKISDDVSKNDILFDVEANKNNIAIKSNATGKIDSLKVEVGQVVKNGAILALIDGEIEEEKPKAEVNFDYFSNLLQPQKLELDSDITIIGGGQEAM